MTDMEYGFTRREEYGGYGTRSAGGWKRSRNVRHKGSQDRRDTRRLSLEVGRKRTGNTATQQRPGFLSFTTRRRKASSASKGYLRCSRQHLES